MQLNCSTRWLLVCLLVVSTCVLLSQAKGGRGGGGRSSSSRSSSRSSSSSSRSSSSHSRPAPAPKPKSASSNRPSPPPVNKPNTNSGPSHHASPRPPSSKLQPPVASKPPEPVVVRTPAYMNYGGIPTGTNIYTIPHKKKGFLGSLMSVSKGKEESKRKNIHYGSYPSPHGVGHMGSGSMGQVGGGFLGKHSSSASMNAIFPYLVAKRLPKTKTPKLGHMPMYVPRVHFHHHHRHYHHWHSSREMDSDDQAYFDVYNKNYVGKCQHPLKKNRTEIQCKTTFEEIQCDAKCEEGYQFSHYINFLSNKCWHAAGVWRPQKNFPDCKPVCELGCRNGGECIRPGVCECPPDFRGDRCQIRNSNFMKCDIHQLTKEEKLSWVCHHLKNETTCKLRCTEPAEFESPPAEEYKCSPGGVWKPDTIPHCVVKKEDKQSVQPPSYPAQAARLQGYPPEVYAPNTVQPGQTGIYANQPSGNKPYAVQPHYQGSYQNQPDPYHPYPVQPGSQPVSYQNQPGVIRSYPVQPNYPGSFHQSNANGPHQVQSGNYNPDSDVNIPYPQQSLGANVWQPQYGVPAPAYMNYGGIPTGTNIHTIPHNKKGFLGSLMSVSKDKDKSKKKNIYYGSYPSPYEVVRMGSSSNRNMGSGPNGHMGSGSIRRMGGGFLDKHSSSASMYTIFPYMAAKELPKIKTLKLSHIPLYVPRAHYHHHHRYYNGHSSIDMDSDDQIHFDVYNENYAGKCQHPLKNNHTDIQCKTTFEEIQCDAKCEEGYQFPHNIIVSRKCWHAAGVWNPEKNFPDCEPVCELGCRNGGECIRPGVCDCPPDFRGDRCQFHVMMCDILHLTEEENLTWSCHHLKNETKCKIGCKEPAEFESPPPAEEYKCTPDGVWKPDTLPHCVVKKEDLENILLESH